MGIVQAEPIKENISVVDSPLTDCKRDFENCDSPEISIEDNKDCNGSTGQPIYPACDVISSSHIANHKLFTRYFVIKSLSHDNIQLSVGKGIWATQIMNEPILEEAFHNSDRVILIFSVNMSGFFQGYAQMMSPVSCKRDNVWSKSNYGSNPWGRTFKVRWLQLCDLPFQRTLHLKNPLNDYKPVKISRDCQELPASIGEALCRLFDGGVDMKGKFKRTSSFSDNGLLKRPCRTSPGQFEDEDGILPEPSFHMRSAGSTLLLPSLPYQHVQQDDNAQHVMLGRSPGLSFGQTSCSYLESVSDLYLQQPFLHRSIHNGHGARSEPFHSTKKDVPHKRNLAGSLTEEDFLSMTYEEYLEAIGSNSFSSCWLPSASVGVTSDCARVTDK